MVLTNMLHIRWKNLWANERNTDGIANFQRRSEIDIAMNGLFGNARLQTKASGEIRRWHIYHHRTQPFMWLPHEIERDFPKYSIHHWRRTIKSLVISICISLWWYYWMVFNEGIQKGKRYRTYISIWKQQSSGAQNRLHHVFVQSSELKLNHL